MNHAKLQEKLGEAVRSDGFMIAVFRLDSARTLHLFRHGDLCASDLERAVELLSNDVMKAVDFDFLKGLEDSNADTPSVRPQPRPSADRPQPRSLSKERAGIPAETSGDGEVHAPGG